MDFALFGDYLRKLRDPRKIALLSKPSALYTAVTEVLSNSESSFITSLTELSTNQVKSYQQYLLGDKALFFELEKSYVNKLGKPFRYQRFNPLLYALVRATQPAMVVETGVAAGISSTFILKALHDNGRGELYSIDLPKYDPSQVNLPTATAEKPGWIIPERFRSRWHFMAGKSEEQLQPLLRKLGQIDLFFHDSLHTYDHMTFEYTTVWPYLKEGGLLLSDNINWNKAFPDFTLKVNRRPVEKYHFGGIKK